MLIDRGRDGAGESVRHVDFVLWCVHAVVDFHSISGAGTARLSWVHFVVAGRQ